MSTETEINETISKAPTHRAYSVRNFGDENEKSYWSAGRTANVKNCARRTANVKNCARRTGRQKSPCFASLFKKREY